MFVQVDGEHAAEARLALERVPGVVRVAPSDGQPGAAFEIDSDAGRDVRPDLARAIVQGGWGLLELRPMRMSLEEIFLSLTTEDVPAETVHE
jgi:ABC-2 type transport system ATP-binding protein